MRTIQGLFNQQGTVIPRGENIQKSRANPKILCQENVIPVPLPKTGSMLEADFTLIFPHTTNSLWCCYTKGGISSEPKKVHGI